MLEDQNLRNDIKMGEVAMTVAASSYGHDGAPNDESLLRRTKLLYTWLMTENKS